MIQFKFPHISFYNIDDDDMFIEHVADMSVNVAKTGVQLSNEAATLLENYGKIILSKNQGETLSLEEDQARIFGKIYAAIQMNSILAEKERLTKSITYISGSLQKK